MVSGTLDKPPGPLSYPWRGIFPLLISLKRYTNRLHEVGETTWVPSPQPKDMFFSCEHFVSLTGDGAFQK